MTGYIEGTGAPAQDGAGLADWARAVWSRRGLVLILFVLFLGTGLGAAFMFPAVYEAQAVVEVLPERQPNAAANPLLSAVADTVSLNTEAGKLGAEPVVRSVFEQWEAGKLGPVRANEGVLSSAMSTVKNLACGPSGLLGASGFCHEPNEAEAAGRRFTAFRKRLSVDAERGTRLIKVSYSAGNPKAAAAIANAVVSAYLDRHAGRTEDQSNRFIDWLQGRLGALGDQVASSDRAVALYRGKTDLIEMGKEQDAVRRSPAKEELAAALQNLAAARATVASARVKLAQLQAVRDGRLAAQSTPEIVGSRVIQDLTVQESDQAARAAGLTATYSASSPVVARARAASQSVRDRINLETAKLLTAAQQDYQNATKVVADLEHQANDLKARAANEELERVDLRGLERRAQTYADLYTSYLRQAREAVEAASWHPMAASVVALASPPVRPVFPDMRLLLPLGAIASALTAMLISALLELHRQRNVFRGPLDFAAITGLRVTGAVPRVRKPISSEVPENFRMSIESVAFRLAVPAEPAAEARKSLAVTVTSAVPGEGKSVLSISLARQFLADGARVAIVDADIRRPSVMDAISGVPGCAAADVTCEPDGTALSDADPGAVHVITLAAMTQSATVLLGSLPRMISNLRQSYQVLIIDTPPLLAVSDALAAFASSDQILFAVGWSSTSRHAVECALNYLSDAERARTRIVLTKVQGKGYLQYGAGMSRRGRPVSGWRTIRQASHA
jgi:succinoglycan biosynthesis transport protein ExoP